MSNEKSLVPRCLGYIGDDAYTVMNRYKDPVKKTTRLFHGKCPANFFFVAQMNPSVFCWGNGPFPKNHGISKLVVWRSQTPAIHIQTPQNHRVQWFLGFLFFLPTNSYRERSSAKDGFFDSELKLKTNPCLEGSMFCSKDGWILLGLN